MVCIRADCSPLQSIARPHASPPSGFIFSQHFSRLPCQKDRVRRTRPDLQDMYFQERFLKLASNTSITPLGAQGPSRPVAIKLSFTRHSSLVPWSWYIIHQVFMELYGYPRTMPRQFRKALLHGLSVYRRSGCQSSSLKHVGLVPYYCSNIPARKFRAGVCICMMYAVPYLHLPSQPTPPSL